MAEGDGAVRGWPPGQDDARQRAGCHAAGASAVREMPMTALGFRIAFDGTECGEELMAEKQVAVSSRDDIAHHLTTIEAGELHVPRER